MTSRPGRSTLRARAQLRRVGLAACLAWAATALAADTQAIGGPTAAANCRSVSPATCLLAARLGRGINLGGMLEAPLEGDWGLRMEPRFIDAAASRFATVRLPVRWSNHAAPTADATLDAEFLARVDSIADALLKKDVFVILDFHAYSQLTGHGLYRNERGVEPEVVQMRFINLWRQLAEHYRAWPKALLFEVYNEPYGKLEGPAWNELLARVLPAIRESNPDRTVLIGPGIWNAPKALPALKFPPDPNTIVTVHTYDPFEFTHQGADWVGRPMATGIACCDSAQRAKLVASLDLAKRWSDANGYPIHVGEFGSIQRAPYES